MAGVSFLFDLYRNGYCLPVGCFVLRITCRHYLDLDLVCSLLGLLLDCYVAIEFVDREVLVSGFLFNHYSRLRCERIKT